MVSDLEDGLSVASSFPSLDTLVCEIVEALRVQLCEFQPSVRNGMEMKHVLLLLVKTFRDLCNSMTFEKEEWLAKMRETVDQIGNLPETVREHTGHAIIRKFEAAPWNLEKRSGQSRSDTAHTILAIYAGIVHFVRTLEAELGRKAQEGVDPKQYDVEEMQFEEEKEKDADPPLAKGKFPNVPKIKIHPPRPPKPSAPGTKIIPPSKKRKSTGTGPGNYNHGLFTPWTVAEWIHLLKLYQRNSKEIAKEIAKKHNESFWASKGRAVQRSTDSVRQQYKKMMGAGTRDETMSKVAAKITELEGRRAGQQSAEPVDEADEDEE